MYRRRHARRREQRRYFLRPLGLCAPGPCVWVDEDVGAFAAGGGAVGRGEERFGPFGDGVGARESGIAVGRGSCGIGEFSDAQLGLGDFLGKFDCQSRLVL